VERLKERMLATLGVELNHGGGDRAILEDWREANPMKGEKFGGSVQMEEGK